MLFRYILTLISGTKITFSRPVYVGAIGLRLLALTATNGGGVMGCQRVGDLYNQRQALILFFLALYLLVILTVVVKLALNFKGALKAYRNHEAKFH